MADTQVNIDYRSLVEQAYIQPIKSVLAIDDQYRALDSYLDEQSQISGVVYDKPRQKQVLEMVRSKSWLADMHDGQSKGIDDPLFKRLHQCDLLLLDYHLDPHENNDPTKALQILATLNENHHFNLVVVYTRATDLQEVKREIFFRLSGANFDVLDRTFQSIQAVFDEWSELGDEPLEDLLGAITDQELYTALVNTSDVGELIETQISPLKTIMSDLGCELPSSISDKDFYLYLLKEKVQRMNGNGDFRGEESVAINAGEGTPIWLKTNRLFVAVISKEAVEPIDLPNALLNALEDWRPTTHRLLLSKIKNELDDNGQAFEEEILHCDYTNAGWLNEFSLNPNGYSLTVSRLMEGVNNSVIASSELKAFSEHLRTHVNNTGLKQSISYESRSRIDLGEDVERIKVNKSLNCYIGTKNVDSEHLATGHVVEWTSDENKEMLLCLTPICDLVPGRTEGRGWKQDLAPYLPVKVIRLIKQELGSTQEKKVLKDITKKPVVVLNVDGETGVYLAAESGKSVFHEQVFADAQGVFEKRKSGFVVTLNRTKIKNDDGTDELRLSTSSQDCRVVGQLRYEYALNLLQLLGQDLTKIGLDFVAYRAT